MLDGRALVDAMGRLYEAALAPDAETRWMDQLRGLLGAEHAVLAEAGPDGSRAWHSAVDEAMHPLVRHLSDTTIYDPSLSRMPPATACRMTDYFPLPELMRHDLYHRIVRPLCGGLALTCVFPAGPRRAAIAVCRDAERGIDFGDDEIAAIQPFMGHLWNAMQMRNRMAALASGGSCVVSALDEVRDGIVVLDGRGGVRLANRMARALLAEGDAIALEHGRLAARSGPCDRRLQALLVTAAATARCLGSGREAAMPTRPYRVALVRPFPRSPLWVRVAPTALMAACREDRASLTLVLADPDRACAADEELLREHYGLTLREAQLAMALARGATLAASAARMEIGAGTARQYLKQVFAKTGVRRQAELVALLSRLP